MVPVTIALSPILVGAIAGSVVTLLAIVAVLAIRRATRGFVALSVGLWDLVWREYDRHLAKVALEQIRRNTEAVAVRVVRGGEQPIEAK